MFELLQLLLTDEWCQPVNPRHFITSRIRVKDIVITMTSIPPRYEFLKARVRSLLRQTSRPSKIEIYIPRKYRRFQELHVPLPRFGGDVEVIAVEEDFGPATKLIPALLRWKDSSVNLVICDDDRNHDINWIRRLVHAKAEMPDSIVCERGWLLHERNLTAQPVCRVPMAKHGADGGRNWTYRMKRLFSAGRWHPNRSIYDSAGFVDVFEGFLGVILDPNDLDIGVSILPDWAYFHDDLWFSGLARSQGRGIWAHAIPRPVFSDSKVDRLYALKNDLSKGGRSNLEIEGVSWFQKNYGIWQDIYGAQ